MCNSTFKCKYNLFTDNYRHGVYYRNSLIIYSFKFHKCKRHIFSQCSALLTYTKIIRYIITLRKIRNIKFQKNNGKQHVLEKYLEIERFVLYIIIYALCSYNSTFCRILCITIFEFNFLIFHLYLEKKSRNKQIIITKSRIFYNKY